MLTGGMIGLQAQNPLLLRAAFALHDNQPDSVISLLTASGTQVENQTVTLEWLAEANEMKRDYQAAVNYWQARSELRFPDESWFHLARLSFILNNPDAGYRYLNQYLQSPGRKRMIRDIQSDDAFIEVLRTRPWIRFWSTIRYPEKEDLIYQARAELATDFPDPAIIRRLHDQYPDDPEVLRIVAGFHMKNQELRKALSVLEAIIRLDSPDPGITGFVADALSRLDENERAIQVLSAYIRQNPYVPEIWVQVIHLGSADHLRTLISLGIQNTDLLVSMAAYQIEKQPEEALRTLSRVLQQNRVHVRALNLRARLYELGGDSEAALTDYTQSLDADPFQGEVYYNRGELRLAVGDQAGACHDWKKALQYGYRKAFNRISSWCRD